MSGLFKKKPDPSQMFEDGNWQVVNGEYDGNPIIVRVNANLKPFAGKTHHTLKIGFAIPFNSPNPGGMPSPEENEQMNEIEDRINKALESKGSAVQALAITTGTFKEFVYYAKPEIDIGPVHAGLMAAITTHEVQCIAAMDIYWDTYRKWADG